MSAALWGWSVFLRLLILLALKTELTLPLSYGDSKGDCCYSTRKETRNAQSHPHRPLQFLYRLVLHPPHRVCLRAIQSALSNAQKGLKWFNSQWWCGKSCCHVFNSWRSCLPHHQWGLRPPDNDVGFTGAFCFSHGYFWNICWTSWSSCCSCRVTLWLYISCVRVRQSHILNRDRYTRMTIIVYKVHIK